MTKSYSRNYLEYYFWQTIAIISNIGAMFVVVPMISKMPNIYGIYSVAISISIFFTYADFGFIRAGFKYGCEYFARGDKNGEIKIIGFSGFILFLFVCLCALIIFFFALNPLFLIPSLEDHKEILTASYLLGILSFSFPIVVCQRILRIIFSIRVEEYIFQRIAIAGSIIKILSTFYFFSAGKYDIVGYYFFFHITNLVVCLVAILIAKGKYHYDFFLLIRSFRFSLEIFRKTNNMAYVTFFSSICHILFYEIDSLVIAKIMGVEFVAIYSIAFTVLTFIRNLTGTFYGPFGARFHHCIGVKDIGGLKSLYQSIVCMSIPLIVLPIVSIIVLMQPLIICWVGPKYFPSVLLAQFLVGSFFYSFLNQPASLLLIAQDKIRMLYLYSIVPLVIYWLGVILTYPTLNLLSFAVFKFISITAIAIISLIISYQFLKGSMIKLIKASFLPLLASCIFMIVTLNHLISYLPEEQSKLNLIIVIFTGFIVSGISILIYYISSYTFREIVNKTFNKLLIRGGHVLD